MIFKLKLVFTRFWVPEISWCCSFDVNVNYCWVFFSVHHPGSGVNYGILDPRTTQVKRNIRYLHQVSFSLPKYDFSLSGVSLVTHILSPKKSCLSLAKYLHLQASHLELLRDHCSGRLTPCCGDGALQVIIFTFYFFFYVTACLCVSALFFIHPLLWWRGSTGDHFYLILACMLLLAFALFVYKLIY